MKKIYPSERAATKATLRAEAAPFAPISFAQIYAAQPLNVVRVETAIYQ